jgi:Undecaprenyl-phosphate glucose phosphotransferase
VELSVQPEPRPGAAGRFGPERIAAGSNDPSWQPRLAIKNPVPFAAVRAVRATSEPLASKNFVKNRDLHSPLQVVADCLFVVGLGVLSGSVYQGLVLQTAGTWQKFATSALVVALLFAVIARMLESRNPGATTTRFDRLRDAELVWSLAFATLAFLLFALKAGAGVSRGAFFTFYLSGLVFVGAWRALSPPVILRLARAAGYTARDCIVIGDEHDVLLDSLATELAMDGNSHPTVIRFRAGCDSAGWTRELAKLTAQTIQSAHALKHGEIYISASGLSADRQAAVRRSLSLLPRAIYVVPGPEIASLMRSKIASVGSYVAVELRREPLGLYQRLAKRIFDVVVAATALVVLFPFLVLVAVAIKLDSKGPVFFRQTRNGYRGQPFRIFKFRTMHVQEDGAEVRQANKDDDRVTRVGRFLRKSSIDELPQLLNILFGEMSLVGPRPHAVAHDEMYAKVIENYAVRQHVKPGLTGWAQVNGLRGETATTDLMYRRIEFDLWYAVNASLVLDFEIMVRTAVEVFRQRNAY